MTPRSVNTTPISRRRSLLARTGSKGLLAATWQAACSHAHANQRHQPRGAVCSSTPWKSGRDPDAALRARAPRDNCQLAGANAPSFCLPSRRQPWRHPLRLPKSYENKEGLRNARCVEPSQVWNVPPLPLPSCEISTRVLVLRGAACKRWVEGG